MVELSDVASLPEVFLKKAIGQTIFIYFKLSLLLDYYIIDFLKRYTCANTVCKLT